MLLLKKQLSTYPDLKRKQWSRGSVEGHCVLRHSIAKPALARGAPPTPSAPLGFLNGRGVKTARWQGLLDVLQVANVPQDLFDVPVVGLYGIILLSGFSLKERDFLVQVAIFHLVFGAVQGTLNLIQFVQVHGLQLP